MTGHEPDLAAHPHPPRRRHRPLRRLDALPRAEGRGRARRAAPAATTPVPAKDPSAQTPSKPGAVVQKADRDAQNASDRAEQAAGRRGHRRRRDRRRHRSRARQQRREHEPRRPGARHRPDCRARADHQGRARGAAEGRAQGAQARARSLVLLFCNNRSDDDRAVRRELAHVDHYGKQVFVARATRSRRRPLPGRSPAASTSSSPRPSWSSTRNLKAVTLVGYVDRDTIDQAVVDALRASGGSLIKNPYFRQPRRHLHLRPSSRSRRCQQPAAAAAIPAYLVGVAGRRPST